MVGRQFDVFLISLDPTVGREIQKKRPCLVISPDEMNRHLGPRPLREAASAERLLSRAVV